MAQFQDLLHGVIGLRGIVSYLYRSGSNVVGRETLLAEVWGYSAGVTTHTVESHMYRLRQKIESDPSDPKILMTKPGGYQLVR